MNVRWLLYVVLAITAPSSFAQTDTPAAAPPFFPIPITCPSLPFQPTKVMQYMHSPAPAGSPQITVVIAHRGYWENTPENSPAAMQAAANNCIEAVEIDLRLSSDGVAYPIHDWNVQRITTGTGYLPSISSATYNTYFLRDRYGNPTTTPVASFKNILDTLVANPSLTLVIDCKDTYGTSPSSPQVNSYTVLKAAWSFLLSYDPSNTLRNRILFKARFVDLPSNPATILSDLNIPTTNCPFPYYNTCTNFNLAPVWYPNDSVPQGTIESYLSLAKTTGSGPNVYPFLWYPETSVPYPNSGLQQYLSNTGDGNTAVFSYFNDYPEGISHSPGTCCGVRNTSIPSSTSVDYRGDFEYDNFQNYGRIGTDKAFELMTYLQALGRRNVCLLSGQC
jgi:hypothetical protein